MDHLALVGQGPEALAGLDLANHQTLETAPNHHDLAVRLNGVIVGQGVIALALNINGPLRLQRRESPTTVADTYDHVVNLRNGPRRRSRGVADGLNAP